VKYSMSINIVAITFQKDAELCCLPACPPARLCTIPRCIASPRNKQDAGQMLLPVCVGVCYGTPHYKTVALFRCFFTAAATSTRTMR
jgi:hypothetical protein